ncbi:hypothetical protein V6250_20285, partial [Pseudoalteromonas undina]
LQRTMDIKPQCYEATKTNIKVVMGMGWLSNPKQSESSNDLIVNELNKSLAVIEFEPSGRKITANSNFLNAMGYR